MRRLKGRVRDISTIIHLEDIYDIRKRKQDELAFYHAELEKLKLKMSFVQQEINVTNTIINIIENDKVIDIRNVVKARSQKE